ncbi:CPBP family intramembrane glutamic endopeptidase [Sphingomicrobium nitratireducens]|uniref:CPBP family intramembrane glutamic endopeptidase n=1 Tax=Sphingomicrobium nitratireducens TaxID=2964666 RepID=UPI00223EDB20|nr:CPBP family intramembrane glutamic endopeptidase [Sphingomicrobium nitratireducens]
MTDIRQVSPFALAALLFALGLLGILSMLTMPAPIAKPEGLKVSDALFKALLLVNPTILLALAVALGTPAARAAGLEAPLLSSILARANPGPVLPAIARPAALGAAATAVVMIAYGAFTASQGLISEEVARTAGPNLLVRLLYGGMTEEILLRWGVMSILAWVLTRLGIRPVFYWIAIIGAALLFAAGHLPFLYSVQPDAAPMLVAAVLVGNAIPGALFGWLFWKRGIEAAMLAHAGGHFLAWGAGLLLA